MAGAHRAMTDDLTVPPWHTISSRLAYAAGPVSLFEDRTLDARGQPRVRHRLVEPDSTRVVAVDDDGLVQLVWRWRYQLGYPAIELPSTQTAPGEPPLEAARRALAEGCGLAAKVWMAAGTVMLATEAAAQPVHLYRAAGLHPTPRPAPNPELSASPMPYQAALAAVRTGGVQEAGSVAGLLRTEQDRLAGGWQIPGVPLPRSPRLHVVR